ncbi:hypothetical protein ACQW02_02615 [Humitalea sp. 24SJ18S-53]|uniref:hypothetical protein n=1 Tax=Humitalea sp. 24SJ18S-53 TaxID=3422307 RepID=UPI003D674D9F
MHPHRLILPALGLMLAVAPMALAQPAPTPPAPAAPAAAARVTAVTARVQSVNQTTREVVLRGADGRLVTIVAGPEVRNLARVRVGDRVVAEFQEAVVLALAPAGTAAPPEAMSSVDRAAEGAQPSAAAVEAIRVRVRIDAVNAAEGRVTFTGPRGQRTTVVHEPALRAFVAGLKPGDEVDVTWAEAMAVRVEPAGR